MEARSQLMLEVNLFRNQERVPVFVCKASQVAESEVYSFDVPEIGRLAVYNVDGTYYVTDDECTHAKASLSDGYLEGTVIECPVHGGQFDVITGKAVKSPCFKPLRTYPARLVEDEVRIESEHADRQPAGSE